MELPFVSVVIPTYNNEALISECLQSILDQSYPKERYEVIVIDNHSTDKSPELIKKFPVTYLFEPRQGAAAARNTGIRQAKGDYILFIDADCRAEKDLIKCHLETQLNFKSSDPLVKVVGGGIEGINKNFWAMCDNFCAWYLNHPQLPPRYEKGHLPTANLSVERAVFDTTDLFDEEFRFGEDVIFCKKIREAGYKLFFNPQATVYHVNRTTFKRFMRHAKEWAQIGGTIQREPPNNGLVKSNNPLYLFSRIADYFFLFWELCHSWLVVKNYSFLLCLPLILLNRLYFGFQILKLRSQNLPGGKK